MDKFFLDMGRLLCKDNELPKNLMQNSWVAFILTSINLLEKNGAIFFVLPIEFLQVQYAEEFRGFCSFINNTVTFITFTNVHPVMINGIFIHAYSIITNA